MKKVLLLLAFQISANVCFANEYKDPVSNVIYTFDPVGEKAEVKQGNEWIDTDDGALGISSPGSPEANAEIIILDRFTVDGKEYTVDKIGDYAFFNMRNITSVSIPSSVESIGRGAFLGCVSLSNVVLSEGLNSIQCGAFELTGLSSITIPSSVQAIELAAFSDTPLTIVTSLIELPSEVPYICKPLQLEKIVLLVPAGTKSRYEATHCWNQFGIIKEFQLSDIPPLIVDYSPLHSFVNYIMVNRTLFDLSGRRLSESPASSAPSVLPKGVYIKDGRKVLVK